MDRKLIDYLPPVLREAAEFRAIQEDNEPEISLAWNALAAVMDNQFLETAKEAGVAIWEKELNLYPRDTDTLEVRKARIKAMWNLELPYTFRWLQGWLTAICGAEGHEESVSDYTLDIQLDYDALADTDRTAAEIGGTLRMLCPANMRIQVEAAASQAATAYALAAEAGWAMADGAAAMIY